MNGVYSKNCKLALIDGKYMYEVCITQGTEHGLLYIDGKLVLTCTKQWHSFIRMDKSVPNAVLKRLHNLVGIK